MGSQANGVLVLAAVPDDVLDLLDRLGRAGGVVGLVHDEQRLLGVVGEAHGLADRHDQGVNAAAHDLFHGHLGLEGGGVELVGAGQVHAVRAEHQAAGVDLQRRQGLVEHDPAQVGGRHVGHQEADVAGDLGVLPCQARVASLEVPAQRVQGVDPVLCPVVLPQHAAHQGAAVGLGVHAEHDRAQGLGDAEGLTVLEDAHRVQGPHGVGDVHHGGSGPGSGGQELAQGGPLEVVGAIHGHDLAAPVVDVAGDDLEEGGLARPVLPGDSERAGAVLLHEAADVHVDRRAAAGGDVGGDLEPGLGAQVVGDQRHAHGEVPAGRDLLESLYLSGQRGAGDHGPPQIFLMPQRCGQLELPIGVVPGDVAGVGLGVVGGGPAHGDDDGGLHLDLPLGGVERGVVLAQVRGEPVQLGGGAGDRGALALLLDLFLQVGLGAAVAPADLGGRGDGHADRPVGVHGQAVQVGDVLPAGEGEAAHGGAGERHEHLIGGLTVGGLGGDLDEAVTERVGLGGAVLGVAVRAAALVQPRRRHVGAGSGHPRLGRLLRRHTLVDAQPTAVAVRGDPGVLGGCGPARGEHRGDGLLHGVGRLLPGANLLHGGNAGGQGQPLTQHGVHGGQARLGAVGAGGVAQRDSQPQGPLAHRHLLELGQGQLDLLQVGLAGVEVQALEHALDHGCRVQVGTEPQQHRLAGQRLEQVLVREQHALLLLLVAEAVGDRVQPPHRPHGALPGPQQVGVQVLDRIAEAHRGVSSEVCASRRSTDEVPRWRRGCGSSSSCSARISSTAPVSARVGTTSPAGTLGGRLVLRGLPS